MRRKLENILGVELRSLAIHTREKLGLTQREMGEKLQMSESSYSNIETGKNKCGMLTSILLLEMQRDPSDFLRNASHKVNEWYEGEMK